MKVDGNLFNQAPKRIIIMKVLGDIKMDTNETERNKKNMRIGWEMFEFKGVLDYDFIF